MTHRSIPRFYLNQTRCVWFTSNCILFQILYFASFERTIMVLQQRSPNQCRDSVGDIVASDISSLPGHWSLQYPSDHLEHLDALGHCNCKYSDIPPEESLLHKLLTCSKDLAVKEFKNNTGLALEQLRRTDGTITKH